MNLRVGFLKPNRLWPLSDRNEVEQMNKITQRSQMLRKMWCVAMKRFSRRRLWEAAFFPEKKGKEEEEKNQIDSSLFVNEKVEEEEVDFD